MNGENRAPAYLYTYACHEDELPLCQLELRSLFGCGPCDSCLETPLNVDPSRSPFIKLQVAVQYRGSSVRDLAEQVEALQLHGSTFKVIYVETDGASLPGRFAKEKVAYNDQRAIEREIGGHIRGKAEMRKPERLFGIVNRGDRWLFGECRANEAVWLQHMKKPQNYSTALSTRVARAVVNIAVPDPLGIKAIDPCCGIGTVLVEALSMGIDIIGSDINPLAIRGARANLAHFGLPEVVAVRDIRNLIGVYDALILDLPYNLCSKLSEEERLSILQSARRLASKVVVITTETIDSNLARAGFSITDRCLVKKGTFSRQVVVLA